MTLKEITAIIDWVSYIILCILACYFIIKSDVIQKYLNKNTDTYETEIQLKEFTSPDFTFCDWSRKIMSLDYNIGYELKHRTLSKITKIENFTKYSLFDGHCFIITFKQRLNMSHSHSIGHNIKIRFNASTPLNKMPQLVVFVHSKTNPQLFGKFYDGSSMAQTINHQESAYFTINEEKTEYLPGNCRTEAILEYLASEFIKQDINCSAKCFPNKFFHLGKAFEDKLKKYPVCEDGESSQCIDEWGRNLLGNVKSYCNKISYTGVIDTFPIQENDSWCSQVTENHKTRIFLLVKSF